jgi:hypothetical protein
VRQKQILELFNVFSPVGAEWLSAPFDDFVGGGWCRGNDRRRSGFTDQQIR